MLHDHELSEPMVRINGTGFGIRVPTLIQIGIMIFVGGGAWYTVQNQIGRSFEKLQAIEQSLQEAKADRAIVAEALKQREIEQAADHARRDEQILNLNLLITDLRKNIDKLEALITRHGDVAPQKDNRAQAR